MIRMTGRTKVIVMSIAVFVAALLAIASSWHRFKTFDPDRWKGARTSGRSGMVDDLIRRRAVLGRTEVQVQDMLGNPDQQLDSPNGKSYWYDLGIEDGYIAIDHEWLVIEFRNGIAAQQFKGRD